MRGRPRLVLALVCLAGLALGACGSDGDAAPGTSVRSDGSEASTSSAAPSSTSAAPATSATSGTIPATTSSPASSTATTGPATTTAGVTVGFDPPCVDRPADGSSIVTTSDDDFATFGPLGATPGIAIHLPLGHGEDVEGGQVVGPTSATIVRIPGGFLVAVTATSDVSFEGSLLAAVEVDGSVRWLRCFEERWSSPVVGAAEDGPVSALVPSSTLGADGVPRRTWRVLSLADGSLGADLGELAADAGFTGDVPDTPVVTTARELLLRADDADAVGAARDRLLRVELATMALAAVPYPPAFDGEPASLLQLEVGADGRPMHVDRRDGSRARVVTAVLDGDRWSTDPNDLAAAAPIAIDVEVGTFAIRGIGADGTIAWERPDLAAPPREGFQSAVSTDVVVVSACASVGDGPWCEDGVEELHGLDPATGETMWTLTGGHGVGVVAGGYAIVTDASGSGCFRRANRRLDHDRHDDR